MMKLTRENILKATAAAIVATMLFPPWHFVAAFTTDLGFGFLLIGREFSGREGTVNVALLLAEWAAILILARLAWLWVSLPSDASTDDHELPAVRALVRAIEDNSTIRAAVKTALDKTKQNDPPAS